MTVLEHAFMCILLIVICNVDLMYDDHTFGGALTASFIVALVLYLPISLLHPPNYERNCFFYVWIFYSMVIIISWIVVAYNSNDHFKRNIIITEILITLLFIAISYPHFDEKISIKNSTNHITEENSNWI